MKKLDAVMHRKLQPEYKLIAKGFFDACRKYAEDAGLKYSRTFCNYGPQVYRMKFWYIKGAEPGSYLAERWQKFAGVLSAMYGVSWSFHTGTYFNPSKLDRNTWPENGKIIYCFTVYLDPKEHRPKYDRALTETPSVHHQSYEALRNNVLPFRWLLVRTEPYQDPFPVLVTENHSTPTFKAFNPDVNLEGTFTFDQIHGIGPVITDPEFRPTERQFTKLV